MEKRSNSVRILLWSICLAVLILDAKTAVQAGKEALELCIQVLIPSLLPFFCISRLLLQAMEDSAPKWLRPAEKFLRLPQGSGLLLLIGLLGGYPTGAATVYREVNSGRLNRCDGIRLLLLCNQAGPAFVFGVGSLLFTNPYTVAIVWAVQLISVGLMALSLPGGNGKTTSGRPCRQQSFQQVLQQSIHTMATVCGWVMLLRITLAFLDKWVLWHMPIWARVAVRGALELSNGSTDLTQIDSEGLRLILFSALLSFGGICVWQQTAGVAADLVTWWYLPMRISQAAISAGLATAAQLLLPVKMRCELPPVWLAMLILAAFLPILCRKWAKKKWKFRAGCSIIQAKEGHA